MSGTEVRWSLFCPDERPLGTAAGEAWLEKAAGSGYGPWKMCTQSLELQVCIKPVRGCGAIRKDPVLFQLMWWGMNGEEAAGGLFFLVATKKQEIWEKQWDPVHVGEKKAEVWVKPSVKVCWVSHCLMYHKFNVLFDKTKLPETLAGTRL